MKLTIYHNPGCSKSRQTLELLRQHDIQPNIIEYLREPPDGDTVLRLARLLGVPVAEILRRNEDDFVAMSGEVSLDDDEALASRLAQYPRVLQRPIVVDEDNERAIIGRPPETVLTLIDGS